MGAAASRASRAGSRRRLAFATSPMPSSLARCALLGALLSACDGGTGPVREWTPQDHEGEQKGTGQVAASAEADEGSTLVEVTWRDTCAVCHGLDGHGDTPQGQMLRVPDLTRPDLAKMDDATL